ncbi:P-loop NTPase fold protein [Pseudomonas fontis]|uniref:P-loop NTPase fold protein n=1 Tax=Pseudomonas fontis TaxID=2942633 RepID=UPI00236263F8|nr:P-loop NTPase fold protein [Pseudomonas fontis]
MLPVFADARLGCHSHPTNIGKLSVTDSINQNIETNLKLYLAREKSDQAILLTGGWGCGKTHFIDNFIKRQSSEKLKLIKVSLFGLSTLSEIEDRMLGAFHPVMDSKALKLLGGSVKKVAALVKLDVLGDSSPDVSLSASADKLNIFNLLISGRTDFALILDDLERTEIDIQKLLGYINHIVETCKIKTILIANEVELEKNCGDSYRKFKEKAICKTFEVGHDPEAVIDSFLEGDAERIGSFKKIILEMYAASSCRNLRSLKQAIDDFSQMYEVLDAEFRTSEQYGNTLAKTFFALSMEVKCAALDRKTLLSGTVLQPDSSFTKKYFPLEHPVLRESFWAEALFSCDYSNINTLSRALSLFVVPITPELDVLTQLHGFQNLEEESFRALASRLAVEVLAQEDDLPATYLRKVDLLAKFIANDLSEVVFSELAHSLKSYTEKYQSCDTWKTCKLDEFSRYEITHLTKIPELSEAYEQFLNTHARAYTLAQSERSQHLASNKLATFYEAASNGDRGVLIALLLTEHRHTEFFTKVDAERFVQALLDGSNIAISEFSEIALERYVLDRLRHNRGSNELELELGFWLEVRTLIEARINDAAPLKKYNLRTFVDSTIVSFCSMLSPQALPDQ